MKVPGLFVVRKTSIVWTARVAFLISLHCGVERLAAGQTGADLSVDSKAIFILHAVK